MFYIYLYSKLWSICLVYSFAKWIAPNLCPVKLSGKWKGLIIYPDEVILYQNLHNEKALGEFPNAFLILVWFDCLPAFSENKRSGYDFFSDFLQVEIPKRTYIGQKLMMLVNTNIAAIISNTMAKVPWIIAACCKTTITTATISRIMRSVSPMFFFMTQMIWLIFILETSDRLLWFLDNSHKE